MAFYFAPILTQLAQMNVATQPTAALAHTLQQEVTVGIPVLHHGLSPFIYRSVKPISCGPTSRHRRHLRSLRDGAMAGADGRKAAG